MALSRLDLVEQVVHHGPQRAAITQELLERARQSAIPVGEVGPKRLLERLGGLLVDGSGWRELLELGPDDVHVDGHADVLEGEEADADGAPDERGAILGRALGKERGEGGVRQDQVVDDDPVAVDPNRGGRRVDLGERDRGDSRMASMRRRWGVPVTSSLSRVRGSGHRMRAMTHVVVVHARVHVAVLAIWLASRAGTLARPGRRPAGRLGGPATQPERLGPAVRRRSEPPDRHVPRRPGTAARRSSIASAGADRLGRCHRAAPRPCACRPVGHPRVTAELRRGPARPRGSASTIAATAMRTRRPSPTGTSCGASTTPGRTSSSGRPAPAGRPTSTSMAARRSGSRPATASTVVRGHRRRRRLQPSRPRRPRLDQPG